MGRDVKICSRCWVEKPIKEFQCGGRLKSGEQRRRSACKVCTRAMQKKQRARKKAEKLKLAHVCPACGMNLGERGLPLYERKAKQASSELLTIARDVQDLFNTGTISHPLFSALALRASIALRRIFGRRCKGNEEKRSELQRKWIAENDFQVRKTVNPSVFR